MTMRGTDEAATVLQGWSTWLPLRGAGSNNQFPARPGLYRIRRRKGEPADYIGETGRQLRGRLGHLQGVYADEMPYADPHTAAPSLWAMRDHDGCEFEASVLALEDDAQVRKALEATAITLHRLEFGQSPAANFGRMPAGYRKSTGNNARLVASGQRARGGRDPDAIAPSAPAAVSGVPGTDPEAASWMNWAWSPWIHVTEALGFQINGGLYRLRQPGSTGLVYVGQGSIPQRLRAHLAKTRVDGHRQASWFTGDLEASWVELPSMAKVHLLEHETDLIASHVLATGRAPAAQFLG